MRFIGLLCAALLFHNAALAAKLQLLGAEHERIPDTYIIGYHKDEASVQQFQHVKANWQDHFEDEPVHLGAGLGLYFLHVRMTEAEVAHAESLPGVDFIHHDMIHKSHQSAGSQSPTQPGLDRLDSETTTDGTYNYLNDGEGVDIYILDTGVDIDHRDWQDGQAIFIADCSDARSAATCDQNNNDLDPEGHGTHVAGIAASPTYGVAKNANILNVRVLGDDGSGSIAGIVAGVEIAVASAAVRGNPSVINMSLGGGANTASNNAVNSAVAAGVTVVVAAGNDGADAANTSPASASDVICVGSSTSADVVSTFSNTGNTLEIFAVGQTVRSLRSGTDGTVVLSGTSMASPTVAGVVAQILAVNPDFSPEDVRDVLLNTASTGQLSGNAITGTPNLLVNNADPDFFAVGADGDVPDAITTSEQPDLTQAPEPDADVCLSTVDELEGGEFSDGRLTLGYMFDVEPSVSDVVVTSITVYTSTQVVDGTAAVLFVTDRGTIFEDSNTRTQGAWTALRDDDGSALVDVNSDDDTTEVGQFNLFRTPIVLPTPLTLTQGDRQGIYVTFVDDNFMAYEDVTVAVADTVVDNGNVEIFAGRAALRDLFGTGRSLTMPVLQLCYSIGDTLLDMPEQSFSVADLKPLQDATEDYADDFICIESSSEDEDSYNVGTGVMFDLTVDELAAADLPGVFLEDFSVWLMDTLDQGVAEVYTTVDGASYSGQETDSSAWVLIASRDSMDYALDGAWTDSEDDSDIPSIDGSDEIDEDDEIVDNMETEADPELFAFNFNMNYELRTDGTPQGFYVTFTEEQMRYYDQEVDESTSIAVNEYVTLSGGKGVDYPFATAIDMRQFSGSACFSFEERATTDALDGAASSLGASPVAFVVALAAAVALALF